MPWLVVLSLLVAPPTNCLYVLPPLIAPADCSVASCWATFATHPHDKPLPLSILDGYCVAFHFAAFASHPLSLYCLSTCRLHLPLCICISFAPAGCHIPSRPCCFADVGARAKGSTLCLPVPSVNKDLTFQTIDTKTAWVDWFGGWMTRCNTQVLLAKHWIQQPS